MSEWLVKKGNTAILDMEVKDKDGNVVTNLNEVIEAKFHVKESKSATAAVKIELTLGDGIEVNTPSSGFVRITLRPPQTGITVKKYFMGLQLKWSVDEISEIDIYIDGIITDVFRVKQEVVVT